ncbi:hypothetical protein Vi05172_g2472 [Venturia inaequalis]|nr:hypothetical protein Vi05172_g2472 [Venturia inaequalis]
MLLASTTTAEIANSWAVLCEKMLERPDLLDGSKSPNLSERPRTQGRPREKIARRSGLRSSGNHVENGPTKTTSSTFRSRKAERT